MTLCYSKRHELAHKTEDHLRLDLPRTLGSDLLGRKLRQTALLDDGAAGGKRTP